MSTLGEDDYDYLLKILLVGDMGVGKSCILSRYCDNEFNDIHQSTIGVDFKVRTIKLPQSRKCVKMQLWDTAGQERFRTVTTSYYRGAHGAFVVFDVTNELSFRNVEKWIDEIRRYTPSHQTGPIVVIGNKVDSELKRCVSREDAQVLTQRLGVKYFETSAKFPLRGNDLNIIFDDMCEQIIDLGLVSGYYRKIKGAKPLVISGTPTNVFGVEQPKRCYC